MMGHSRFFSKRIPIGGIPTIGAPTSSSLRREAKKHQLNAMYIYVTIPCDWLNICWWQMRKLIAILCSVEDACITLESGVPCSKKSKSDVRYLGN